MKLAGIRTKHKGLLSHPVRVRGLKRVVVNHIRHLRVVAPRAGAWVETIVRKIARSCQLKSHPVRVRGLKPQS